MTSDSDRYRYWIDKLEFIVSPSPDGPLIRMTLIGPEFPPENEHGGVITDPGKTWCKKDLPTKGGYFLVSSEKYDFELLGKKTLDELLTDDCPLIRAITAVIAKQGTSK